MQEITSIEAKYKKCIKKSNHRAGTHWTGQAFSDIEKSETKDYNEIKGGVGYVAITQATTHL